MGTVNPSISITAQAPRELVISQLEAIFASDIFKNSSRLSRFLRHVVEHSLEGDTALKERQLGVEVFDRDKSYDTRADPVVRVEARQLRFKLGEYYANTGVADEIVISLPKGGYAAHFERRLAADFSELIAGELADSAKEDSGEAGRSLSGTEDLKLATLPRGSLASGRHRSWAILLVMAAGAAFLLAVAYLRTSKPAAKKPDRIAAANPEARDLYLKGI